jgi:dextranase
MPSMDIPLSLQPCQAFWLPSQMACWKLNLQSALQQPLMVNMHVEVSHLAQVLWAEDTPLCLLPGEQVQPINWQPPGEAPRGYGLDIHLLTADGHSLASLSSSFDVLEHWTQMPRYGFLSDFSPARPDPGETLDGLLAYRINALQFYDWMYRHDTLLADHEPYYDPLGRLISRQTIDELIQAAHERQVAAMPYTAVYGASLDFLYTHPEWGLFGPEGKPVYFFDFLAIMDPRPAAPWTRHLLSEYQQMLQHTAFDGIHIDQYGDPKLGFDAQGQSFDLAQPLAKFIDAARRVVDEQRSSGTVIFNAVGNWPIEAVAPAEQDLVYIEVWPPLNEFSDLHNLIVSAQPFGGGKPVILAAYIPPEWPVNVRLADAVIFASGGGHIELGEQRGLLADPYFPKYGRLTPDLEKTLQDLYAFAVRYQELIGPHNLDATPKFEPHFKFEPTSQPEVVNIQLFARESGNHTALSLVNFSGLAHTSWNQPLSEAPQPLEHLPVQIDRLDRPPQRIWLATPDGEELGLKSLPFKMNEDSLLFELPSLLYWDLIFIEWNDKP